MTRVRSAVDELMVNDSDFLRESEDEKNLTLVIIDKIGYGLQWVIDHAPTDALEGDLADTLTSSESGSFTIHDDMTAEVQIPADVVRVLSARLSSWSLSPVPVTEQSQVWLMQQDAYARGSWDRPVTVVVYHGKERWLHLYGAKADSDTLSVTVVRKPAGISTDGESLDVVLAKDVNVPSRLLAALIYYIAALAMTAFREDVASRLMAIAKEEVVKGG